MAGLAQGAAKTVNHYVTYFDRGYLAQGVALWRSLALHDPEDWELDRRWSDYQMIWEARDGPSVHKDPKDQSVKTSSSEQQLKVPEPKVEYPLFNPIKENPLHVWSRYYKRMDAETPIRLPYLPKWDRDLSGIPKVASPPHSAKLDELISCIRRWTYFKNGNPYIGEWPRPNENTKEDPLCECRHTLLLGNYAKRMLPACWRRDQILKFVNRRKERSKEPFKAELVAELEGLVNKFQKK